MSKFYVGQRVRFVRSRTPMGASKVGKQVTITGRSDIGDWQVQDEEGDSGWVEEYQIEPILYDGNQLVSWESMKDLWTPAGGVAA